MDFVLMSTEGKQVSFLLFEEIQFITVLSDTYSLCFLLKSVLASWEVLSSSTPAMEQKHLS